MKHKNVVQPTKALLLTGIGIWPVLCLLFLHLFLPLECSCYFHFLPLCLFLLVEPLPRSGPRTKQSTLQFYVKREGTGFFESGKTEVSPLSSFVLLVPPTLLFCIAQPSLLSKLEYKKCHCCACNFLPLISFCHRLQSTLFTEEKPC